MKIIEFLLVFLYAGTFCWFIWTFFRRTRADSVLDPHHVSHRVRAYAAAVLLAAVYFYLPDGILLPFAFGGESSFPWIGYLLAPWLITMLIVNSKNRKIRRGTHRKHARTAEILHYISGMTMYLFVYLQYR